MRKQYKHEATKLTDNNERKGTSWMGNCMEKAILNLTAHFVPAFYHSDIIIYFFKKISFVMQSKLRLKKSVCFLWDLRGGEWVHSIYTMLIS